LQYLSWVFKMKNPCGNSLELRFQSNNCSVNVFLYLTNLCEKNGRSTQKALVGAGT
jgi:hypothetical protein